MRLRCGLRYAPVSMVLAMVLAAACRPAITLSMKSPDGRYVAVVKEHPCIDGPCQSIWLGSEGKLVLLRRLGEDSDWVETIAWSEDGSTVGFLVQGARLVTVDAATARIVAEVWLTEWNGEAPPAHVARGLSLSPDGRQAIFRDCPRRPSGRPEQPRCSEWTKRLLRPAV